MLNEELMAQRRSRVMTCIMLCLGVLLLVFFITSLSDSLQPTTPDSTEVTETSPTEDTTTIPETEPPEPSRFEGITAVFGDNSLQAALTGVSFEDITEKDKEAIETVMKNLGGTVTFTENEITLTLEGQSAVFYPDLSTVLIDADGNAGGTRWLDSKLSKLVTPPKEEKPALCLTKEGSFAAKYNATAAEFTSYCDAMTKLGWAVSSNSDMVYIAERTTEETGKCSLTVSFADGILTILVQAVPAEPTT